MAEERVQPSHEDWLKNGQERINGGVIMARNSKWSEDMLLGGRIGTAMAEVVIRKYLQSIWIFFIPRNLQQDPLNGPLNLSI